jgi:hypothetical protein
LSAGPSCYALGGLDLVGIVAINGGSTGASRGIIVASIFGGGGARRVPDLGARRSWARPAATVLLWILVIIGILRVVLVLLGAGTLTVPLEAILAALVLTTLPPGQRRDMGGGTDRTVAEFFAAIYAMTALLPLVVT